MRPQPKEEEVRFILDAIADYLSVEARAQAAGRRPAALHPRGTAGRPARHLRCLRRLSHMHSPAGRPPAAAACLQRLSHMRLPAAGLPAASGWGAAQVRRTDVLAAWSGIRPLATDPNARDTASASRDHVATVDPDGMLTITGAGAAQSPCPAPR